jgi:Spy/CpxP family protein refolding chaperone
VNRTVALLAVVALFVSGVVIGALGMHLYYAERLIRPGAPPMMAARMLGGHLERRLDLSVEQQRQIETILAESRREAAELRIRLRPDVEALIERTGERIAAVLTPQQRREFDEMRRRDRRRTEQLLLGPVAPPGPPEPGPRRRPWRRQAPPPPPPPDQP